jgi:hypothetical protein
LSQLPEDEYPQTGQPPLKRYSAPAKPQAGQRTEAKNLPHRGHFAALRGTSSPQFSQKKRGAIFYKYTSAGIGDQVKKFGNFGGLCWNCGCAADAAGGGKRAKKSPAPACRYGAFFEGRGLIPRRLFPGSSAVFGYMKSRETVVLLGIKHLIGYFIDKLVGDGVLKAFGKRNRRFVYRTTLKRSYIFFTKQCFIF